MDIPGIAPPKQKLKRTKSTSGSSSAHVSSKSSNSAKTLTAAQLEEALKEKKKHKKDKADKDKRATIAIPSGISTPLDNILMPTVVTPTSADNSTATSGAFLMPTTFVESASSAHLKPAPVSVEITPDYDCSADLAKLETINSVAALQSLHSKLTEEVRSLKLAVEKQKLQTENLNEKFKSKQEEAVLIEQQKSHFDQILSSFAEDLKAEAEELTSIQSQIRQILAEMEMKQQAWKDIDVQPIRQRRRDLMNEFQSIKDQFQRDKEEHIKLLQELEQLKAQKSFDLSQDFSTLSFSSLDGDYGFKMDGFDTDSFGSLQPSASMTSLPAFDDTFDFSKDFNPEWADFGSLSGTSNDNSPAAKTSSKSHSKKSRNSEAKLQRQSSKKKVKETKSKK